MKFQEDEIVSATALLSRRRTAWAVGLLAFCILPAAFQDFTLDLLYHQADAGYHLQGATRLLAGQVPYRDFIYTFPPLGLLTLAFSFTLFGANLWAAKLPAAFLLALSIPLAYRWLRSSHRRSAALVGCGLLCLLVPFVLRLPYPLNLCLAPAFLTLQQLERVRPGRLRPLLWAGVGCGLCLGLKHNVGILLGLAVWVRLLVVPDYRVLYSSETSSSVASGRLRLGALLCALLALFSLALMFLFPLRTPFVTVLPTAVLTLVGFRVAWRREGSDARSFDPGAMLRACLLVGSGMGLACLPWVLWLALRGGLGAFLGFGLIDTSRAGSGWMADYAARLAPSLAWPQLSLLAVLFLALLVAVRWSRARPALLAAVCLLSLAGSLHFGVSLGQVTLQYGCLGLLLFLGWKRGEAADARAFEAAVAVSWFAVLCFPAPTINHAAVGLAPALVLALARVWARPRARVPVRLFGTLLLCLPALAGWLEWAPLASASGEGTARIAGPHGGTWAPSGTVTGLAGVQAMIDARTRPGEPLVAWPSQGLVAFLAGRENPTELDYFWPGYVDERAEARLLRDLQASRPPILLLVSRDASFGNFAFEEETPGLHAWIRAEYAVDRSYRRWLLLLPRERISE